MQALSSQGRKPTGPLGWVTAWVMPVMFTSFAAGDVPGPAARMMADAGFSQVSAFYDKGVWFIEGSKE